MSSEKKKKNNRSGLNAVVCLGAVVFAFAWIPVSADGAERFKGINLDPVSGSFVATKDAPVLDVPDVGSSSGEAKGKAVAKAKEKSPAAKSAAKKVGDLKKGDEVTVFGKSGAWLAVQKGADKLGFVAQGSLAPILDGTLAQEISGVVSAGGYNCRYAIRFEGRTVVEMGPGRLADYSASFVCERGSLRFTFETPMFMSEIPHQGGPRPVYQIALDVLGISPDPDQAFSTILFYDREKEEVALETAWPVEWLVKAKPTPRRVGDVAAALAQAAELTLSSWGAKPWEALSKRER